MGEKTGQYIDSESPFCRNCTRDDCLTNGDGCKAWETTKNNANFFGMNTRIW